MDIRILSSCLHTLSRFPEACTYAEKNIMPGIGSIIDDLDPVRPADLTACQETVHRVFSDDVRKRSGIYFTVKHAREIIAQKVLELCPDGDVVVGDPFAGSGMLLTEAASALGDRMKMAWGVELHPVSALVAYSALVDVLGPERVRIWCGDAFSHEGVIPETDVIVTNPPFTRWRLLESSTRELLSRMGNPGRRDANLGEYAVLWMDSLLREGALLATVLPSSVLYTDSSSSIREMLMQRYSIHQITESGSGSFSDGSSIKEVILVCRKGAPVKTRISKLTSGGEVCTEEIHIRGLPVIFSRNWQSLFAPRELRELVLNILLTSAESGTLREARSLLPDGALLRGIEIYGPEFFFLPNSYWDVISSDCSEVKIRSRTDGADISIPKEYLIKVLRRPSDYKSEMFVSPQHYMVALPEDVECSGAREYVRWGEVMGISSKTGGEWFSHVRRQLRVKNPSGTVFLPDKVDYPLRRRAVYAHCTDRYVHASKNFHIVKADGHLRDVLVLWFNSSVFLAMMFVAGRRISDTWIRLLEKDYLELPVPDPEVFPLRETGSILNHLRRLRMPPYPEQLDSDWRRELDAFVLECIGVRKPERKCSELHRAIRGVVGGAEV